jgi:hypothetical protein
MAWILLRISTLIQKSFTARITPLLKLNTATKSVAIFIARCAEASTQSKMTKYLAQFAKTFKKD